MDKNIDIKPVAPDTGIGSKQVLELTRILERYKAGKARTEHRIIGAENWWKLRNSWEEAFETKTMAAPGFKSRSGWLHNVITNKHADAMEAYPEPNILPREETDKAEAAILSAIIPCVIEQNRFEDTYSDILWQKMKYGTGVYKVVWDAGKLNGLGDVGIEPVNLLNIYWEPGVTDIQRSRYFFHTELWDKDVLQEMYPQLEGKLKGETFVTAKFLYDDTVDTANKSTVIECYYHKHINGKKTLQYVKYVNDTVLYATENIPEMAARGLYDHGKYPYVFDTLYPIEGSPCGYGFVDLCRNPQTAIDMLNTSFIKNAAVGSSPRYFVRSDGSINVDEFLDVTNPIVQTNGNLGEDALRRIEHNSLDSVYVGVLDRVIQELRETSGNTETATGTASSGVTAASAIAALQEASGKGSRDSNRTSYRAFNEVVELVIELIRQFYDMPRHFRIVGENNVEHYVSYTNQYLKPQYQGNDFGIDMGYRIPTFDIKISAQKKNVYTKVTQNELALQFFQLGFFNPQLTDQALMCLQMMDFDGREQVAQQVAQNGSMHKKLAEYMQLALMLAQKAAPELVAGLSNDVMQTIGGAPAKMSAPIAFPTEEALGGNETTRVRNARQQAAEASQVDGGAVTAEAGDAR